MLAGGLAEAQVERLELAGRPRLVDCNGKACFRLTVNVLDAQGQPMRFAIGAEADALGRFHVSEGGTPSRLFHVGQLDAQTQVAGTRGRYSMLLVDVSGSMSVQLPGGQDTRFTAAKRALESWVTAFEATIDHVAVVPFESHRVADRVRSAAFAGSAAELRRQIDGLPRPEVRNNTALYSAVATALAVLEPYGRSGNELFLIVLTDGVNDVRPGDDPGLLDANGLPMVRQLADQAGVPVFTIGFGAEGQPDFDSDALKALAWPGESNYRTAGTAEALENVYGIARTKLTSQIELTVGPVRESKGELAGQTVGFTVTLNRPGRSPLETRAGRPWVSNLGGAPYWEGVLTTHELEDFIRMPVTSGRWLSGPVVRLVVLLAFSALLAILWFGLPRLLWPERYLGRAVAAPPASAARPRVGTPAAPGAHGAARTPGRAGPPSRLSNSAETAPPARADEPTVYLPPEKKPRDGR
jgi:Ca-activated chloride channel family protein